MSDQLKFIVGELSKPPFKRKYNLISFDSLSPENLLQVLTDVLAEIDTRNKVDIREEEPEQTAVRILAMLRVLKYKPQLETASNFRQNLVQGHKQVIHPILEWILQRMPELKKRAYLAKYLVKIEVPPEILGDMNVSDLYEQYDRMIEEFKTIHKDCETMKKSGFSTSELRADIEAMEKEKDIVTKRIEQMQRKVENLPNREAMLSVARNLRLEHEKEKELGNQKQEQRSALAHTEQRLQRLQQQLKELRTAAMGATPEGLLQRLEEETNVNTYIVKQKLPKEIEGLQKEIQIFRTVLSESAMGRSELDKLNKQIQSLNAEVNQIRERRLASMNPAEDKLEPFRKQAAIIAGRKETTAEKLSDFRRELASLEEDLQEKQAQLNEFAGETVLRGEEFKRYVNKLRGRSTLYKRKKAELSALKAETGVLQRTIELLESRNDAVSNMLSAMEAQHGVSGFRDTEDLLEKISGDKANIDQEKGKTLEEMSTLVLQLSQNIASRKAQLAPLIKELRPLREECQEITTEYEARKHTYDSTAAGLDSVTGKLEQEVRSLQDELAALESKYHVIEAQTNVLKVNQERLADEIRMYVNSNPQEKKLKSLRDQLSQRITEQEKLGRQLKEDQRAVKENHTLRTHQMKLWQDLEKLLECKKMCLEKAKQGQGTVHRERGAETLVLQ